MWQRTTKLILAVLVTAISSGSVWAKAIVSLHSPNYELSAQVSLNSDNALVYQVKRRGEAVIQPSALGLTLANASFASELKLNSVGDVRAIESTYSLIHGKKRDIVYQANEVLVSVENSRGDVLAVRLRLSNDGLAFRYELLGKSTDTRVVISEQTSYGIFADTLGWLQPKAAAQSGWMNTNPSYEEEYQHGIVGKLTPQFSNGWVYPALFKYKDTYLVVSEAGITEGYAASHLVSDEQGIFELAFPHPAETVTNGQLLPEHALPFTSPWRLLLVGDLDTIAASTLGTDVANPLAFQDTGYIKPGPAAWSWGLLKDESVNSTTQREFIDYAADMHWPYVLVDVNWDQNIGYDGIAKLSKYAASKSVRLWLWYNSSGHWNQTVYSPKGQLLTQADRRKEFARLQDMGIAGVKIDFFPGDGAAVWDYFKAILSDAAEFKLMVNFHGVTLPRGLQREYPNLMTAEGIKGQEMITFFQDFADRQAYHATLLPFTRNLFDPMDFTPTVLGDIPNIERRTTNAFELAETVLFYSGVQHIVTTPAQMPLVEPHVKQFLQTLPTSWDDTKLIAAHPGKYVVLARKAQCQWFIAGISAQDTPQQIVIPADAYPLTGGTLLMTGENARQTRIQTLPAGDLHLTLSTNDGFVLTTQRESTNDCKVD
ncbi:glycoside hydrolase family 97 protein [Aestuariibacter sp. GS-14]|uniref:glycoside hydrolase family 97 protein n=1 Tax=Aestuariibacter sp. GS-14 TaxID=2590670 RepID=UPI001129F9F4|nr:glycoside hydrolase family 97 protein [Aestuariibacter sp. GS-14]TPV57230.1 glycoside hydrolase family 97 protein [Aestuariibacter sp. GS-14]